MKPRPVAVLCKMHHRNTPIAAAAPAGQAQPVGAPLLHSPANLHTGRAPQSARDKYHHFSRICVDPVLFQ